MGTLTSSKTIRKTHIHKFDVQPSQWTKNITCVICIAASNFDKKCVGALLYKCKENNIERSKRRGCNLLFYLYSNPQFWAPFSTHAAAFLSSRRADKQHSIAACCYCPECLWNCIHARVPKSLVLKVCHCAAACITVNLHKSHN